MQEQTISLENDREKFLLGVISYLDNMDCWYLDQAPEWTKRLEEDFGFKRDEEARKSYKKNNTSFSKLL